MISVEELSKLYLKAYPDDLYEIHKAKTEELEKHLEEALKAVFPDQFLNYYLYLKDRIRSPLVGTGRIEAFRPIKPVRLQGRGLPG